VGLVYDAGFEVDAGREIEPGVGGPRITVDAAVFATAVRVDGAVEGDVGRFVVADHAPRGVGDQLRRWRGGDVVVARPAVVHRLALDAAVAVGDGRRRAAALDGCAIVHAVRGCGSVAALLREPIIPEGKTQRQKESPSP